MDSLTLHTAEWTSPPAAPVGAVEAAIEQSGYALFLESATRWCKRRLADDFDATEALSISNWLYGLAAAANDPAIRDELEFVSEFFIDYPTD